MSLRVWLPLNGDLHDQGLEKKEVSTLGTISWVDGKFGKALKVGNGSQVVNGLSLNSNLLDILSEDYSVSIWVNPAGEHVHYNGTFISSGNWNGKCWAFGLSQNNKKVDVLSNRYNIYIDCEIPINTWTHLVCVRASDNKIYLYKNGEYIDYITRTDKLDSDAQVTTIGRETYANGYFSFNGSLSDLRIYDHALSESEVKKLSEGKFLHLPLNRNSLGKDNLIINSSQIVINRLNATEGSRHEYQYANVKQSYINLEDGEKVCLSFDLEMIVKKVPVSFRVYNTNHTGPMAFSTVDVSDQINSLKPNVGDTIKTKIVVPGTLTKRDNPSMTTNFIEFYSTYGSSNFFKITNLKMELGDEATSFCYNENDPVYSKYQLNNSTEKDISGFQYNALKNNITYSPNSPKYELSSILNGSNSYIKIPDNTWMSQGMEELTVSIWAYKDDWSKVTNGGRLWSCTENGGFNIQGGASGYWRFPVYCFTNAEKSSQGYKYNNSGLKVSDLTSGWHMITWVYTTSDQKIYLDGKLYNTHPSKTYGIKFNTAARLFLGCEAKTASPSIPYFNGQLSDFRMYGTALSDERIKELYEYNKID